MHCACFYCLSGGKELATKPGRHTRRGRPNSVRRPIRGLAVPSIPSIRTILNTIMAHVKLTEKNNNKNQIKKIVRGQGAGKRQAG